MPTFEGNSIINTLFGCCLGWSRRGPAGGSSRGDNGVDRGANDDRVDERTPLIANDTNNTKSAGAAKGQSGSPGGVKDSNKPALYVKRNLDLAKLKQIRDQANDAFFHIDNSQLLPSTSSSRPMNTNASHTGRGQRKDYLPSDSRHQQSLVAESDKAERLYRAALMSPAHSEGQPFAIDGIDEAEQSGKARNSNGEEGSNESEAPLSLVRQMKVSIREASPSKRSMGDLDQERKSETIRKPSLSPQESYTAFISENDQAEGGSRRMNQHKMEHHPSLHSLRTLRLSVATSSPSLHSSEMDSTDDEDWNQRGRTRSKRGLAWMDVGQSRDVTQRPKLDQVFKDMNGAEEGGNQSSKAKLLAESEREREGGEEVPNALRLSAKPSEVTKKISDRLKAMSPINAESIDGNHDVSTA